MTLAEIARALNGDVSGKWVNVRGPGHSSQDRSLGVRFDPAAPDGFAVNSFSGDDPAECRAHVSALLQKLNGELVISCEPDGAERARISASFAYGMRLWEQSEPVKGTIAATYLRNRGCKLVLGVHTDTDVIRFHPLCPFGSRRVPAMLALITDAVTGDRIGVHRTAIKDDGSGKRELGEGISSKMVLGSALGGAIRLHAFSEHLGIAEGIETALSATQVFGIAVWAVASASGIAGFPILQGVKRLTVFADHDNAGIKAARQCGRRYEMSGIAGEIHIPPVVKSDWNDWLLEQE